MLSGLESVAMLPELETGSDVQRIYCNGGRMKLSTNYYFRDLYLVEVTCTGSKRTEEQIPADWRAHLLLWLPPSLSHPGTTPPCRKCSISCFYLLYLPVSISCFSVSAFNLRIFFLPPLKELCAPISLTTEKVGFS